MNKYQVESFGVTKYIVCKDNKNYKVSNKRLCWFCQKECYDFIAICEYCKYYNRKKKNNN